MLNELHNVDERIYIVAYQGNRVSSENHLPSAWTNNPDNHLARKVDYFQSSGYLSCLTRQYDNWKQQKSSTKRIRGMSLACHNIYELLHIESRSLTLPYRIPHERSLSKYLILWISKKCVQFWKVWWCVHFPTINGPTFSTFWKRIWCCCCDRMQCLSGREYCSIPSDIWWENTRSDSTSRDMADWRSSSGLGRLYNIEQNMKPVYSFYKEKWWVANFE